MHISDIISVVLAYPMEWIAATISTLFSLFLLFPCHPFFPVTAAQAFVQLQSKLNWHKCPN